MVLWEDKFGIPLASQNKKGTQRNKIINKRKDITIYTNRNLKDH